jgi:hypothetical protein
MPKSEGHSDLQLRRSHWLYFLVLLFVIVSLLSSTYIVGNLTSNSKQAANQQEQVSGSVRISASAEDPPDLLLSVPFYVYEEFAWINATYMGRPISDVARNMGQDNTPFKHGDDYWFLEASLKHPMRTHNMSEAKLFFVPFLLNYLDQTMYYKGPLCSNGKCDFELLLDTQQRLRESKAFQLYPDRHLIVRSAYNSAGDRWNVKLQKYEGYNRFMELYRQMNVIVFEGKDKFPNSGLRHALTSYYVGAPCALSEQKPYDVAMIASLKSRPSFRDRKNICRWLNSSSTIKTSVCGPGKRCPALAESKFGFHAAGDTWGSQRLMDTILSGTVPIFTHLNQYEIAGKWIDWSQLSYYLPVHDDSSHPGPNLKVTRHSVRPQATQEVFLKKLQDILNDTEGYARRHKAVVEHIPLFDYTTLYPFDTYMYLFQAELYPETRHKRSRWSALRLPVPLF